MSESMLDAVRKSQRPNAVNKAGWEESLHPRGFHGRFGAAAGHLKLAHGVLGGVGAEDRVPLARRQAETARNVLAGGGVHPDHPAMRHINAAMTKPGANRVRSELARAISSLRPDETITQEHIDHATHAGADHPPDAVPHIAAASESLPAGHRAQPHLRAAMTAAKRGNRSVMMGRLRQAMRHVNFRETHIPTVKAAGWTEALHPRAHGGKFARVLGAAHRSNAGAGTHRPPAVMRIEDVHAGDIVHNTTGPHYVSEADSVQGPRGQARRLGLMPTANEGLTHGRGRWFTHGDQVVAQQRRHRPGSVEDQFTRRPSDYGPRMSENDRRAAQGLNFGVVEHVRADRVNEGDIYHGAGTGTVHRVERIGRSVKLHLSGGRQRVHDQNDLALVQRRLRP